MMSQADEEYELNVLKLAIERYLDEMVTATEPGIQSLQDNRDWVVWELGTKIYTQSGYKIKFSIIRDVVDTKIQNLKLRLPEIRLEEEARRIAEKEETIFMKVRQIVKESLEVEEDIDWDSHLANDLQADDLEIIETIAALEEEFDVQIPDFEAESNLILSSLEYKVADKYCRIKNLVQLIYNETLTRR